MAGLAGVEPANAGDKIDMAGVDGFEPSNTSVKG